MPNPNGSLKFVLMKAFFACMSLGMVVIVVLTSMQSNIAEALPELNKEPWFVTTIIDFYFNVAIIGAWMIYKERNLLSALFWIVSFVFLGSIATAFYVLLQLMKLKQGDSWDRALLRS